MKLRTSAALLIVAVVLAGTSASAQQPAPSPEADDLVSKFFHAAGDPERAVVVKSIRDNKAITIKQVEDAIRRGVFYDKQPTGTVTRKITVEATGEETDCTLWIPDDYDPKTAYPAVVCCHGTGGTGQQFVTRWLPYAQKRKLILICPTGVSGVDAKTKFAWGRGHQYSAREPERSVVISAINSARRDYHIDSDRVYITGVSMGGHCTWDSAATRADYFAGAFPEAGVPLHEGFPMTCNLLLVNLMQVRMYVVQGTPDKDAPKINTEACARLQKLGYAVTYRQIEGGGHDTYLTESDAGLDFILQGKRDPYAKHVIKTVHRLVHGRAYWIKIEKLTGPEWDPTKQLVIDSSGGGNVVDLEIKKVDDSLAHVDAKVLPNNVIDVKTKNVSQITVYLQDNMVDMDKLVTIRVNGHSQFAKKVPRDVGFMLNEARKECDTGRTYYAGVKVMAN